MIVKDNMMLKNKAVQNELTSNPSTKYAQHYY
jgi:hypothetical protein